MRNQVSFLAGFLVGAALCVVSLLTATTIKAAGAEVLAGEQAAPAVALPASSGTLDLPDECPQKPAIVWTMALRGYFDAPGVTSLDTQRGWHLFLESVKQFQLDMLKATRCAVGVTVDLYPHYHQQWEGSNGTTIAIPADNEAYEKRYDIVAYRFPVKDGTVPFAGGAVGRVQLYPVSGETEAPAKAVAAAPYAAVLVHETLHTLTGWAQQKGTATNLPPDDVHATPRLPQYEGLADIEYYNDYLRGAVRLNGAYTGLPPEDIIEAGRPTEGPSQAKREDPRIRIVVTGTTMFAWSASSAPMTVTYPTSEGQARLTRSLGTRTTETRILASPTEVTVCAEQQPRGIFAGDKQCLTVPRTVNPIPLPEGSQGNAH